MAVLNRSYEVFARTCGFEIDPCRRSRVQECGGHHLVAEDAAPLLEALFEVSIVEARP